MRTALLIGLIAVAAASGAQAQFGTFAKPKADRDPYDLPKSYRTNPYDRDYSRNVDTSGPGYRNVDGSPPRSSYGSANRNSGSWYGGYSPPPPPPAYGARSTTGSNRDTSRCRVGLVC